MRKVLIIEDDVSMQQLVTDELGSEYEVKSVSDGNDAIAQANILQPDVILLDVNLLGEVNGLVVLELIHSDEFTSSIPVLVYTNSGDDLREEYIAHGATAYFTKADTDVASIATEVKKYADMPLAEQPEKKENAD